MAAFHERGLVAEVIGTLDDSGLLRIAAGGETATVLDVRNEPVTGLPPAPVRSMLMSWWGRPT